MNILVLGGAGYVGRVMIDDLARDGHRVVVYDLFPFSTLHDVAAVARVRRSDTRSLGLEDFAGCDAVIDMAAISNDPSGNLDPRLTHEVNGLTRVHSAELAKRAGVGRYVLFSSCSVYGANDTIADESFAVHPLTEYAASNVVAEQGILALGGPDFTATAFRLATVFGLSPSMRFDLVVNTMVADAFENGCVTVTGGGKQYRPLVHVRDIALAAQRVLGAAPERVTGELFNIAHANLRMDEVAAAVVSGLNRAVELVVDDRSIDRRNYRVATAKARHVLGFVAERTVAAGAADILTALQQGTVVRSPTTIRLEGYRRMLAAMAS